MIENITQEEFQTVRQISTEGWAVQNLQPLSGIKFPCRWHHQQKTGICAGTTLVHRSAKKGGFRVSATCKKEIFYVFRYE
jgi:hypothetical protein